MPSPSPSVSLFLSCLCMEILTGVRHKIETQITYWLLGGKNIRLDGGGTIDGSGQVQKFMPTLESLTNN